MNTITEFDSKLTETEKKKMKQFLIYRTDPSNPNDEPTLMSYYIGSLNYNQRPKYLWTNVFRRID